MCRAVPSRDSMNAEATKSWRFFHDAAERIFGGFRSGFLPFHQTEETQRLCLGRTKSDRFFNNRTNGCRSNI
jgi:hypothetical protein